MFNVGTAELLVILLVALLVLGPTKLPEAARQVGRALGELRRLSSGFQAEMRDALREPLEGTPSSGGSTTPAKTEGALSSPKPSAAARGAGERPPTTAASGAGGAGAGDASPAGADSESGDDPGGGDGGVAGAPTGRGGTATSPPAHDPGSNGSSPA